MKTYKDCRDRASTGSIREISSQKIEIFEFRPFPHAFIFHDSSVHTQMSAFQHIEASALLHSLKMSDIIPAVATLITAILSIIYVTINHKSKIQKKLIADAKYLADYEAEVDSEQKRADFQAKLSQENRVNLDREAKYLQETKLEHVNTVCKKLSESLVSFMDSQKEMRVDMNQKVNEIKETLVQQQVGIDMINQEIEMIYRMVGILGKR